MSAAEATIRRFAGDLPVYWGTGYPIAKPHVLVTSPGSCPAWFWAKKFLHGDDGSFGCWDEAIDVRKSDGAIATAVAAQIGGAG